MRLALRQTSKQLYNASFLIMENDVECGSVFVDGGFGVKWPRAVVNLFGGVYMLEQISEGGSFTESIAAKTGMLGFEKFCTYNLFRVLDSGKRDFIGSCIQAVSSEEKMKPLITFNMNIFDESYKQYSIAYGRDGYRNPIYKLNEEVALICKDAVVCDDLHHYDIYALEEHYALIAILYCIYGYLRVGYKPGKEVSKSKYVEFRKTNDKRLLEKDDFRFEYRC